MANLEQILFFLLTFCSKLGGDSANLEQLWFIFHIFLAQMWEVLVKNPEIISDQFSRHFSQFGQLWFLFMLTKKFHSISSFWVNCSWHTKFQLPSLSRRYYSGWTAGWHSDNKANSTQLELGLGCAWQKNGKVISIVLTMVGNHMEGDMNMKSTGEIKDNMTPLQWWK